MGKIELNRRTYKKKAAYYASIGSLIVTGL
jgi:hypothetical protein